jgi:uncharacterized RDD family membrane protein YckC
MSQPYEQAPPAPSGPAVGGPSGPRAGFWRRFGAAIIDGILLAIVDTIVRAILPAAAYLVLSLIINWGYYTAMEGSARGATLGKMALGIRVLDFERGGRLSYGRALVRNVAKILSTIPIFLGYFWMLWDGEKRTWHDKIAGAVVVPADAYR